MSAKVNIPISIFGPAAMDGDHRLVQSLPGDGFFTETTVSVRASDV